MNSHLHETYDESALLSRLQAGDPKAFEELYTRFSHNLLGVLLNLVHDPEQAEDLLQDSFIKIWGSIHCFDPLKGRLFTWMMRIVRNTALDYLRQSRPSHQCMEEVPQEKMGVTMPAYQTLEVAYWVDATLEVNQRQIINLVYYQGYTQQEISDEFGLPMGTIKSRVRLALKHLRKVA